MRILYPPGSVVLVNRDPGIACIHRLVTIYSTILKICVEKYTYIYICSCMIYTNYICMYPIIWHSALGMKTDICFRCIAHYLRDRRMIWKRFPYCWCFCSWIHRYPLNSLPKWPVMQSFDTYFLMWASRTAIKDAITFTWHHCNMTSSFHHVLYHQVPPIRVTCFRHDDVIKWKHFPRTWPFVRGIHRSRWIPNTKASDAELWCFLWSVSE